MASLSEHKAAIEAAINDAILDGCAVDLHIERNIPYLEIWESGEYEETVEQIGVS